MTGQMCTLRRAAYWICGVQRGHEIPIKVDFILVLTLERGPVWHHPGRGQLLRKADSGTQIHTILIDFSMT